MDATRRYAGIGIALVLLLAAREIGHAQVIHAARPETSPGAAPIDRAVRIDGRLDEPLWGLARPAGRFMQLEPSEGDRPAKPTDVRVLFTDDAVIVGARLEDDDHLLREAVPSARQPSDWALPDYFQMQIDPHRDHRTAFDFVVTVRGETRASLVTAEGTPVDSWTIDWESAVVVDERGWTIEMRIPLSEMHVERGKENWGLAFKRFSWKRLETDVLDGRRPPRLAAK